MVFFSLKLCRISPKIRWLYSHLCILSELRANKVADNKINGAVGSNGRKAPIIPKPKLINPKSANMFLMTVSKIKSVRFNE